MASKEKLRAQRNEAREIAGNLRDTMVEFAEELNELEDQWKQETTEYEADLQAEIGRREIAERGRKTAETKALTAAAQTDRVVRERDDFRRQVQSARVAYEQLQRALYPTTFARGGTVPGAYSAFGDPLRPLTVSSGMSSNIGVKMTPAALPFTAPTKPTQTVQEFFRELNARNL